MKKPIILFIQGGGEGAHAADMKLASYLQEALDKTFDIRYPKMPMKMIPIMKLTKLKLMRNLRK